MHEQVQKAVTALVELQGKKEKTTGILEDVEKIQLQFVFKKIPTLKNKIVRLCLPRSLHHDSREVCIFVKDLDTKTREYEKTVHHFQDLFAKHGISSISKIVPLKALRTDYTVNSAKISLAKAYDLYLADERIMGFLPGCLGKMFYAKKSTRPVQVNLTARDLRKELDSAVNNSRCIISGKGSDCMATVGHCKMSKDSIIENIIEAIDQITAAIPGGLLNIRSFNIKTPVSMAIPVYYSAGSGDEVTLTKAKEENFKVFVDEVTTVPDSKVRVRADGAIQVLGQQPHLFRKKHLGKSKKGKQRKGSHKPSKKVAIRTENVPDKKKAVKRKAEASLPETPETTKIVAKKAKIKVKEGMCDMEKNKADEEVTVKKKRRVIEEVVEKKNREDVKVTAEKHSRSTKEPVLKKSKMKSKGQKGRLVASKVVKLKSLKK